VSTSSAAPRGQPSPGSSSEGRIARHDEMVGLVETMRMTADSLRLTAYGPDEDENEMRIVEDLPKASWYWPGRK
jgi:hypothetical protein